MNKSFILTKIIFNGTEYGNDIFKGTLEFYNEEMSKGILTISKDNQILEKWKITDGEFTNENIKSESYKYSSYSCTVTSLEDDNSKGYLVGIYQCVGKGDKANEIFGLGLFESKNSIYFNFAKIK